jgi:hypothetical protein
MPASKGVATRFNAAMLNLANTSEIYFSYEKLRF